MSEQQPRESILIADCGSITTKVVLLDIVSGQYRFIARGEAPTTAEPHWSDVTIGLSRAVAEVEAVTGRKLVGDKGRLLMPAEGVGTGVDLFVATTSAAPALKTVLTGLMDDVSLASARRVALSTYATVEDVVSLADNRSEEERVRQYIALEPDVFLITGGTDGGAADPVLRAAETISMAVPLMTNKLHRPTVVYAGNPELRTKIADILHEVQWRAADNVRPQVSVENLESAQAEMAATLEDTRLLDLPGARELRNLADGTLIPTAKAFGWTVNYLGEVLKNSIVAVDVGSASVTMGAVLDGKAQLQVRSDLGIGHHLPTLLDQVNPRQVSRWLPYEISAEAVQDYAANKALFPRSVPMTTNELLLELALTRELIRAMLPAAFPGRFGGGQVGLLPPVGMILAGGAVLANAPRPGQMALVLLDALQPVGLCTLALDTQGLAPALGACAAILPVAAVQVIESGAFRELGGIVAPIGQGTPGEIVLQLTMAYENGSELEVEVQFGSLEVLPLPPGQQAELSLKPSKRFDVGAGRGRGCRRRVYGGAVGLIVDARGRPLLLAANPEERRAKMQQWIWDMGG